MDRRVQIIYNIHCLTNGITQNMTQMSFERHEAMITDENNDLKSEYGESYYTLSRQEIEKLLLDNGLDLNAKM